MIKYAEKDRRRKELVESMSPEELAEYDRVHMEFRQKKVQERTLLKEQGRIRMKNANRIIIDCSYDDLMKEGELKSLRQ